MTRSKIQNTVIGVTGVSGSGKTTVTRILVKRGAYAVIADELSHTALQRGNPPYNAVLEAFGGDILDGNGEIDRRGLGGLVFGNPERMRVLESIIHPYVYSVTEESIKKAMEIGGYKFAVIDAPMLFEAGMHNLCDKIWAVTAYDNLKIESIIKRDGITREAAEKRLAARDGASFFSFADIIIENNGSTDDLERRTLSELDALSQTRC